MRRQTSYALVVAFLFLAVFLRDSRAVEVLQHVPQDALGFVVARDIGAVDAKSLQVLTKLQVPFAGPLVFLQAATGISEGLDVNGDLLLAVLPDDTGGESPKFCVWLPVADYERFVVSLGSKPDGQITAVTVSGVDLLVAHRGKWALVMDPDERGRMEQMLAAEPAPPKEVSTWRSWIETNDVTAVALAGGLHDFLSWTTAAATLRGSAFPIAEDAGAGEDPFRPLDESDIFPQNAQGPGVPPGDIASQVRGAIHEVLSSSAKLLQWAHALEAAACGMRLDDEGNLRAGVRAVWSKDSNFAPGAAGHGGALPPSPFDGGQYIVHGAGNLPQPLTAVLAGAYVRLLVDDLKTEMGLALDADVVARFQDAVEQAAANVPSAGLLMLTGAKDDGVYTNNFLVVRVESAKAFVDQANEVMRLWNQMNREADDGTRLVFDVEDVPMGDRTATHYTIDIAAADGAAVIPEVRQAMEKLFGPGGKMRLIVAPADDHHVLLAMATPEQAQQALKTLLEESSAWDGGDHADRAGALLPREGDWRLFFSPRGHNRWSARQMDAITGPVFGGPIVKEFPDSPPIGVVGGAKDYELWIDAAAPAETVQAAGTYLKNKTVRNRR